MDTGPSASVPVDWLGPQICPNYSTHVPDLSLGITPRVCIIIEPRKVAERVEIISNRDENASIVIELKSGANLTITGKSPQNVLVRWKHIETVNDRKELW